MKSMILTTLAIVLVLLTASSATAAYGYLSPVNPGSVTYVGCGCPSTMVYTSPTYSTYYAAYSPVVTRYAASPIVTAVPMAAQPIVGPYPTVVARPVVAVPSAVVYPAPVVVRQKVFIPGQPIRNVVRGVLP